MDSYVDEEGNQVQFLSEKKVGKDTQSTRWRFTLNNYTSEEITVVRDVIFPIVKYGIYGEELAPTTGTPHLQGFLIYYKNQRFSAMKKVLPRATFLECDASNEANRKYCIKDGAFVEKGHCPLDKGGQERKRWADALTHAKAGNLEEIDPQILICHYSSIKKIKLDYGIRPPDLDAPCGTWIYGEAGSGKSHRARQLAGTSVFFKNPDKWWDGYQGEDSVIIDDLDKTHKTLARDLKIWSDKYAFVGEVKGSAGWTRPKKLIVTSQYHLTAVFEDAETQSALLRRFTLIQWFEVMRQ